MSYHYDCPSEMCYNWCTRVGTHRFGNHIRKYLEIEFNYMGVKTGVIHMYTRSMINHPNVRLGP